MIKAYEKVFMENLGVLPLDSIVNIINLKNRSIL